MTADLEPVDYRELLAEAQQKDEEFLARIRSFLGRFPDHANVPIWEHTLEHGWWGTSVWRESSRRTKEKLAERTANERDRSPAVTAQGELFT